MKNDGSKSQDEFEKLLNLVHGEKNVWVYKLPDTKSIRGALKHGFVSKSPCDFFVMERGTSYLAEVKSTTSPRGYSFSFEKMQWIAMTRAAALGSPYFVFIHAVIRNKWYKVPCEVFVNSLKKSFTWDELSKYSVIREK